MGGPPFWEMIPVWDMRRDLLEKLAVTQLANKFISYYGNDTLSCLQEPPLDIIQSQMNPVHNFTPYLF
jgi:hypothetical protein